MMTTITAFMKRRPILTYYVLTFLISWGGILIVVGGPGALPSSTEQVERLMLFVLLALFAGPSLSSIILTGLISGRTGYRDLFARMTKWRVHGGWYAVALLTAPLLVTAVLLALSLVSPVFLPRILTTDGKAMLLVFGIGWGLVGGGLLEELGWTGFAIPQLLERHSILATGLIVGFLWGVWHYLVAFWMISGTISSPLSPAIFLPALVFYTGSLPAYRVLVVWLYDRTGASMLVAMLMHAVFSASMLILEPVGLPVTAGVIWGITLAAVLWIVVGVVALTNHGHLSRPHLRPQVV